MNLLTEPVGVSHYLVVGAVLFVTGAVCMATKRNALGILMGIELVLNGETLAYRAVPLDTPEALDKVTKLMGKGEGAGYTISRTVLLWAPIKPVRLDPKAPEQP